MEKCEILFKGKRTDNGEWIEGRNIFTANHDTKLRCFIMPSKTACNLLQDGTCGGVICGVWLEVVPETVSRFTGLTDKFGKKIFEGDLLIWKCAASPKVFPVIFKDGCFIAGKILGQYGLYYGCEIVGNIYDNPELLKDT